jgi:two-component system LytT family sensor kinase
MQRSFLSRYWIFQLAGWGLFAALNVFFAFLFSKYNPVLLQRLVFDVEMGILFSHIMREVILRSELLIKPLRQQITIFVILTLVFSLLIASIVSPYEFLGKLKLGQDGEPVPYKELLFTNLVSFFTLMLIWNFIYFVYHFIVKSQRQQLDTLQLEALVKSLELKTIKAHINPHFIFNALNGIRALIDENPVRARKAITELSNILRSSLNAEKGETVSLGDELKIVKDYLALENMRFEDRLKIEYEIDDDTLDQQVPPMMLQTLVENAIKHGISKNIKGGVVKITSDFTGSYHELSVQNTGRLNGGLSHQGFGLSSTHDRLTLLYGEKAKFVIKQLNPDLVEAKVLIPSY